MLLQITEVTANALGGFEPPDAQAK